MPAVSTWGLSSGSDISTTSATSLEFISGLSWIGFVQEPVWVVFLLVFVPTCKIWIFNRYDV